MTSTEPGTKAANRPHPPRFTVKRERTTSQSVSQSHVYKLRTVLARKSTGGSKWEGRGRGSALPAGCRVESG